MCALQIAAQFYYDSTMEGVVSSRGGTAPYRPLCSVLYSRRGRFCTIPCVWFNLGGDGSLLSPVFGSIEQGGDGSVLSPVFGFI